MRKVVLACALAPWLVLSTTASMAQIIPPYHRPAAEAQTRRSEPSRGSFYETYGPSKGKYHGGAVQSGPSYPSYWTYNRFSNTGFGGLNFFFGPLGGYTPYVVPNGSMTYGYPNFGPYYSYVPLAPVVRQARPYWIGATPWDNPAIQQVVDPEGDGAANPPAQPGRQPTVRPKVRAPQPPQEDVPIVSKKPSAELVRRSLHYQVQGDDWFSKQNYLQAYGRYKQALSIAPGRTEPRFRMALALTATSSYTNAVEEIKRAMRADPGWPSSGPSLDELFGTDNNLAKNAVLHKVAGWVREDIRDPDRLFLMGVLLHFNDDDKASAFFEASAALSPNPTYAEAFLSAEAEEPTRKAPEEPVPMPPDEDEPAAAPARVPAKQAPQGPTPKPLARNEMSKSPNCTGIA